MELREPVVAGMFYSYRKENLKEQIAGMFRHSEKPKYRIVVSPHAAYMYSGKTAAKAITSLINLEKVIVIGPNHHMIGAEFSVMSKGIWRTPLGDVSIDERLSAELLKSTVLEVDSDAHLKEHSIEVQLPLLQKRFGKFSFSPISIANCTYSENFLEKCKKLGETIGKLIKKDEAIGVVASSDFSHYISRDEALKKDMRAIERLAELDVKGFFSVLKEEEASVCGYGPIAVAAYAAKRIGCKKAKVIEYASSGNVTGDHSSVVGYAAIGFC